MTGEGDRVRQLDQSEEVLSPVELGRNITTPPRMYRCRCAAERFAEAMVKVLQGM